MQAVLSQTGMRTQESLRKKPFHLKKTSGGGKTAGREKERFIGYPDRYRGGVLCGGGD
jgi:hypothetical protein